MEPILARSGDPPASRDLVDPTLDALAGLRKIGERIGRPEILAQRARESRLQAERRVAERIAAFLNQREPPLAAASGELARALAQLVEALHGDAVATVWIELARILSARHDDEFGAELLYKGCDQSIEGAEIARVATAEGEGDVEVGSSPVAFAGLGLRPTSVVLRNSDILGNRLQLQQCLACPCVDLFVRKDFPQRLGVLIVVVGLGMSCIFYSFHMLIWSFGALFATALVDLVLYSIDSKQFELTPSLNECGKFQV